MNSSNQSASETGLLVYELADIVANLFWGISFMLTRIALRVSTPLNLLSIRFLISLSILLVSMLFTGKRIRLKGKHLLPLIILLIAEPGGFVCETYAIEVTNSTITGLVLAAVPIAAIGFAAVFLREMPTKRQLFYSLFPIIGVILITVSGSRIGAVSGFGILLLLGMCLFYAGYRTSNRKAAMEFNTFERTFLVQLTGAVFYITTALISLRFDLHRYMEPLSHADFVIPVLFLCIFCSVAANLCANFSARRLTVLQYSVIGTLSTICSTFCGVFFLHEPLTAMMFLGAAMVIFGILKSL